MKQQRFIKYILRNVYIPQQKKTLAVLSILEQLTHQNESEISTHRTPATRLLNTQQQNDKLRRSKYCKRP